MTRLGIAWVGALALLVGGVSGCGKARGTVTGRVFQAQTLGIMAGAIVVAKVDGEEIGRTTTDAEGRYEIKVPVRREVVLAVLQPGHLEGLEVVVATKEEPSHVETHLAVEGMKRDVDAASIAVMQSALGARVKVPPSALQRADGTPASGQVSLSITALDPKDRTQRQAIPGKARARDLGEQVGAGRLFEPQATFAVKAEQATEPLSLAQATVVEIKIPVSDPFAPTTVDLFHLEEESGEWVRVGVARRQTDSAGNEVYSADVDRLGVFAAGRFVPATCLHGCVERDGRPVPGATVTAAGVGHDLLVETQAGADGCFVMEVLLGGHVQVHASVEDAASVPSSIVANGMLVTGPVDPSMCVDFGTIVLDAANVGEPTCPLGFVLCGTSCVDPSSDQAHCGGCTQPCAAPSQCIDGSCGCPASYDLCTTVCTATPSDPANCGNCGMACVAMQECIDGNCQDVVCAPPLLTCDPYCADGQNDDANCGVCGRECASDGVCVAGACTGGIVGIVAASGIVRSCEACAGFPGVTVRIDGIAPPISTVTDAAGAFTLDVAPGIYNFHTQVAGYWDALTEVVVAPRGVSNIDLVPLQDAQVAMFETALSRTFSRTDASAVVLFDFGGGTAAGGESASILPIPVESPFTTDGLGMIIPGSTLVAGGNELVGWSNVGVGAISAQVLGSPGMNECVTTFNQPTHPTLPGAFTILHARCANSATLSGTVCEDDGAGGCLPVPNANVELLLPTGGIFIGTTTDAVGTFSMQVPGAGIHYVRARATGYWGTIETVAVGPGGLGGIQLGVNSFAQIAAIETEVGRTFNTSQGIVTVQFDMTPDLGGETAWISGVTSDPAFTITPADTIVDGNVLLPGVAAAGRPRLIGFTNVAATFGAGTPPILVDARGTSSTCLLVPPNPVVIVAPQAMTIVHATCAAGGSDGGPQF